MVLVLGGAVAFAAQSRRKQRLNDAFQRVARVRDGEFTAGGWFARPSVRFSYLGTRVLLDTFSTGGKHPTYYTQLHLDWPHQQLRLEVFPEGFLSRIGKLLGTQDIQIGSPAFDRDYVIRGNDVRQIREILTASVQSRISSLRQFLGNNDIYVARTVGTLLIKKRKLIREVRTLQQFISLGLALYDDIKAIDQEGIEFVEPQPSSLGAATNAICQICGEEITSAAVHCKSCKTPHHEDCWTYSGACSTYGCGQTKFMRRRRIRTQAGIR